MCLSMQSTGHSKLSRTNIVAKILRRTHNKWWTALREAHSKRAELTSGLSVGMSLCLFVCLFVSMCHARGVCRGNQQSFWDAKCR